jgi:ABC-type glycerol-3-phosphate transport system substrate-binding protein
MITRILAVLAIFLLIIIGGVSAQDAELNGTIQFYPQQYYAPEARPEAAKAVEELFAEYMETHPGVTVELVPYISSSDEYRTWLLTRLAAGEAPNITWEQYSDRNNEGADVWVPLTEYFEMPNPYVPEGQPGHDRWGDLFAENVLAQTRSGDGNWYQVSMDWVETGLFYNKELLSQAGVEPDWANWTEFIQDCEVLRSAGIEPVGVFMTPEWSTYQWLDDLFMSAAFGDIGTGWYLDKYDVPGRDFRMLKEEEFSKAILDGNLSVNDERFDKYLEITKQFADSCLMEGFAGGVTYPDMVRLFVEGQVATAWLGSWSASQLQNEIQFDYGLTYLPPITTEDGNPYAVFEDTSFRVGGPSSAGQYGITKATADAGLLEEAIDVLMFWTAPQNFQRAYDAFSDFVPMIAGVEPSEISLQFQFVAAMPERIIGDPIGRLTPKYGTEHNRLFQQFMLGEITAEELKAEYQPLLEEGAAEMCQSQNWDWCSS